MHSPRTRGLNDRRDAGGDDNFVKAAGLEAGRIDARAELERDAVDVDHAAEIAQRFDELLLAGDALGQVELPADL